MHVDAKYRLMCCPWHPSNLVKINSVNKFIKFIFSQIKLTMSFFMDIYKHTMHIFFMLKTFTIESLLSKAFPLNSSRCFCGKSFFKFKRKCKPRELFKEQDFFMYKMHLHQFVEELSFKITALFAHIWNFM